MKTRKTNLLFALFLTASPLLAQQGALKGHVFDQHSGASLPEVSLFLVENGKLLTTDKEGLFESAALVAGKYHLQVFREGYSTQLFPIQLDSGDVWLDIPLQSISITMEAVEIQASETGNFGLGHLNNVEGMAIFAGKKTEVIQIDQIIGNVAANNAREIYKGIAGLNIWENDGSGLQLNIGARGLDPNRTSNFNTRQNGYDISADALGYPESYYTPPTQALSRIEIIRGAASLQYGTQFGGVLNFKFKEPPKDRALELVSETTFGSFNFLNTFNSLAGTKGKFSYYSFYQYKQGDGWRPNSQFDQHAAFGKLNWEPSAKFSISLEYTFMDYLAQQAGGLQDFEFEQDPRQSKRARNWFKVNWNLAALHLDYKFSDQTKLNLRGFGLLASRAALGELGPINRPDPLRERNLLFGNYRNYGSEARLIHQYQLHQRTNTLLAGVRFYEGNTHNRQGDASDGNGPDFTFLHPEDLENSEYRFPSRNLAFFAEHLFNLTDWLNLTPGLRWEYISTNSDGYYKERVFSGGEVIFEQRFEDQRNNDRSFLLMGLGLEIKPNDHLEAYANFSQNYRSINFSDIAVVNPNLLVDSLLKDENGYNMDLGFRGRLADNRIQFDLSAFLLQYRDRIGIAELVVPDPVVYERLVNYRTNIGDARILGLEAYLEADIWKLIHTPTSKTSVKVFANFSWLQGTYTSGGSAFLGNQVELIPPISLKTGLSMQSGPFRASYQFSFVQEHYSDATNAEFVVDATRGVIPSYSVMDVSLSYTWKRFRLSTGVNNLLDQAYFTRRATGYPGPGIIPADGRSFYGGLRINL